MDTGRLLIYSYLPASLIPEDLEKLGLDRFFELMAMADYIRDLRIEDIRAGVVKAFEDVMPDE